MATSRVRVTEGSGKNLATHSFSEDAETKEIQRININNSSGVEVIPLTDTALRASPVPVSATDLDIRNLTNTDVVTAELSATDNAVLDAIAAVEGTTAGAAVITDANGTIQQYLRGLVKLLITTGTIVLGAGTAAIGKLAANANVDIGAVEIAPNANEVHGTSGAITDTTSTQVIAAQGAGQRIYVTSLLVTNSHATVGTLVTIQDDAGSPVVLFAGYAAPAGGGFSLTFPTPLSTTANQKLMAICGTTGANVYVSANGFKGA